VYKPEDMQEVIMPDAPPTQQGNEATANAATHTTADTHKQLTLLQLKRKCEALVKRIDVQQKGVTQLEKMSYQTRFLTFR
jgi:hypothetical protein